MKNLLRAAAIAVASTALVAGGAVTTGANAAPGDTATITLQETALPGYKTSTQVGLPLTLATNRQIIGLKATVVVNGVAVAANVPVYSNVLYYQRAWGAGVVTLVNFVDYKGQAVAGTANQARVRYGLEYRSGLEIKKRGKKLTFKLKARYVDAAGKNVGVRKATIQVKKGSKWRTLKKVNLKKNGTKTYKRSDKKKRNYRLVIKTTDTYAGGQTKAIKI